MSRCLLLLVGMLTAFLAGASSPVPVTLVLYNANVHTLAANPPHAEAICISGDRILYVGMSEGLETCSAHKQATTRYVDLHGATVVPGWTDAHYHLSSVGWREMLLNLEGTPSAAALAKAVAARVATAKPGDWIIGRGWIETHWQPAEFPTRAIIDSRSPGNPVVLERADGHAVLVNAAALKIADIDARTSDPAGGRILRDANGEPNGILIDRAADLVTKRKPPYTEAEERKALKLAEQRSLSLGLTMIHDAGNTSEGDWTDWADIDLLRKMYRDGDYRLRVYKAVVGPGEGAERLIREGPVSEGGRLTVRAIKLQVDGALGSRGAALLEPYADEPSTRGLFRISDEKLRPLLRAALREGIQIEAHAIGDEANRHTLDLFEETFAGQKARKVSEPRWRIEHAQVVHPSDRARFAKLGVIPSMQPSHAISDLYFAPSRLGMERLDRAYSWQSFLDLELPIPGGSDAPVERGEPMIEFYAAVARKDLKGRSGEGWHPEQAVSREDALRMFTVWPAYAAFAERDRGTLEKGKLADLTVLSNDILKVPEAQILETRALMTVIGGEIVYRASP